MASVQLRVRKIEKFEMPEYAKAESTMNRTPMERKLAGTAIISAKLSEYLHLGNLYQGEII